MATKGKKAEADSSVKPWWSEGVQFECQGSGKCCVSHGEFGFVYLTLEDRQKMAKHVGLTTAAFTKKYCLEDEGHFRIDDKGSPNCIFLEGKKCGVYQARPTQCRTWPFWPEVMNAKSWKKEVAAFCPGVGKGRVWSAEEIQRALNEQMISEAGL